MSDKKYLVPEELANAFNRALDDQHAYIVDGHDGRHEDAIEPALEAATLWLIRELDKLHVKVPNSGTPSTEGYHAALSHVRRMFEAPEPEVPDAVKDLLWEPGLVQHTLTDEAYTAAIIEAYRRGKAGK